MASCMVQGWLEQSGGDVYCLLRSLDVETLGTFDTLIGKALWDLPGASMPKAELKDDMT